MSSFFYNTPRIKTMTIDFRFKSMNLISMQKHYFWSSEKIKLCNKYTSDF